MRRRLVAVAVPPVVVPIARKQIGIARRRAKRLDKVIEFGWLLAVRAHRAVQQRGLVRERDDRLAADAHEAMLGLAAQPVAVSHLVLDPGEDGSLFKTP